MQETLLLIQNYLRMIWRYRWVALLVASFGCVSGWAAVMAMPDVFEVESKMFLDTRTMLRPLLKGLAVESNVERDASLMMRRTLLVRPNLETVARKTDMDLDAKTPEQFERMLDSLAKKISVRGTGKENIFVIRYQNRDPKRATRVVEALLNIFVEKSLGQSRKDTSQTKAFLAKQITEYETRLDSAEQRLKEFKQQNFGLLPQDGRGNLGRLEGVKQRLN